jgi:asparagine synthase (glutamine-hydrolysing)
MVSLTERPLGRPELLEAMGRRLRHRGPDATGSLLSSHAAFGVERLRIVDGRPQADQPYHNPSRTIWLICNGEIYNAPTLRTRFGRYPFRSRGDVESLVPLLEAEGTADLHEVEGMFALAAWRPEARSLTLARDRAGEKPLFYIELGGEIWFASEIQALLCHPDLRRELHEAALLEFLALGYVPEPHTIFQHVHKVPAGVSLTCRPGADPAFRQIPIPSVQFSGPPAAVRGRLRRLMENAVAKQMAADVPVGVFTSGGVDSSWIAALASRAAPAPIHTFTATFTDATYDEGPPARRLSRELGTHHVETVVGETELHEALHTVVRGMAEPLADPALLPTYLLARAAKEHVGVVLTGEGADELFGGYPTYLGHRLAGAYARAPGLVRRGVEGIASSIGATESPVPLSLLLRRFTSHAGDPWLERHIGWFGTGLLAHLSAEARSTVLGALPTITHRDPVRAAMELDFRTYLRDGLLVKLDRAGMLVSLETRAPFLDPHVIAFARGLPAESILRPWRGKAMLVEAAKTVVPRWVLRRRKRGLSVPIARWINRGLRDEVDRLFHPDALGKGGVLPALPINELLSDHRAGRANHARALWPVVVLRLWLDHWAPEKET